MKLTITWIQEGREVRRDVLELFMRRAKLYFLIMKPLLLLLGRTLPNKPITSSFLTFPDNCGASVFYTRSRKT